jgi:hypothetical protein
MKRGGLGVLAREARPRPATDRLPRGPQPIAAEGGEDEANAQRERGLDLAMGQAAYL